MEYTGHGHAQGVTIRGRAIKKIAAP